MKFLKIAALIAGGALYLACPIDFIPDVLPPITFADDAAVIAWVVKKITEITKESRNILLK